MIEKKYNTKVLILGSGAAGLSAAIYTARAALNPILVAGFQSGGQLTTTTEVENYPGFEKPINGPWLMEQMIKQSQNVGTKIIEDEITSVDFSTKPFKCISAYGTEITCDSLIIATGAQAKWLGLESESYFQGFGVSSCATCDAPFFKDQDVVVIGGGNSAVEEALFLTNHAKKVYLLHRRDSLRAEKILQDRLFSNPKIFVIWNSVLKEILGTSSPKSVEKIRIANIITNEEQILQCQGVFIAIGHSPSTKIFKDKIELDTEGYIITKNSSTKTSVEGVFAAGDVQDKIYRQAVTAAGSGCMAALDAEKFLRH